jgi:predicted CoA-binding protein
MIKMTEIDHGFTTDMIYGIAGTFTGGLSTKGLKLLKSDWYNVKTVYPICSTQSIVEGLQSYKSLKELPEQIDVLIVVHKRDITTELIKDVLTLSYKLAIWFMPGTDSPDSIALLEDNNIKYGKSCLMGHREFKGIGKFVNMHYFHSKLAGMNRIPKQKTIESNEEILVVE